ncbi:hypothetical protein [Sphingomonas sp.]|nr:hypothetical protein [Sphingomonas sp.]
MPIRPCLPPVSADRSPYTTVWFRRCTDPAMNGSSRSGTPRAVLGGH